MIPFYIALARQVETLMIGITLLMIRWLFTGDNPFAAIPAAIKTPGWMIYFATLWFGVFPYMIMKTDWPHYGIWSILYDIHPWLCWISVIATLCLSSYFIYKRYSSQA